MNAGIFFLIAQILQTFHVILHVVAFQAGFYLNSHRLSRAEQEHIDFGDIFFSAADNAANQLIHLRAVKMMALRVHIAAQFRNNDKFRQLAKSPAYAAEIIV